ncbi:hypothetical protein HK100_003290 [Physocladia obscura]|uniref:Uncharacterized protein n=1 Tax=Physocladia obscura TaxID=109957 RepID=A0AAD5T8F9_9FUNG|nr:hypothetical protein HK100_003290 [Physocladia obscura]
MVVRATTVTTTVAITTALIASTLLVAVSDAACTNPIVRSEWSQLTADQKSLYVAATQALAARPASGQYVDPTQMGWDDFVQT